MDGWMDITRLSSNEIFSPPNKIYREVGRAKDLSAPLYLRLFRPSQRYPKHSHCILNDRIIAMRAPARNAQPILIAT